MKVFISWSGRLSHRVALILREWLGNVLQSVDPYVSSEDIDKGARWSSDISGELESSDFGIICLTNQNKEAPWILFEAGALSKSVSAARVTPLLIDLPTSAVEGPLAQFQATKPEKSEVRKMVHALNSQLGEAAIDKGRLDRTFEKWWPEFSESLNEAKREVGPETDAEPARSTDDILEELLQLTRSIARSVVKASSPSSLQLRDFRNWLVHSGAQPDLWSPTHTSVLSSWLAARSLTEDDPEALARVAKLIRTWREASSDPPNTSDKSDDGDSDDDPEPTAA